MLESAFQLLKKGILREPLHFQFVLGVPGGMSAEPQNLIHLLNIMKSNGALGSDMIHWGVAGVGRHQLPLAVQAILMGGHVRVGFEDNIFYKKGEVAKSNAQFIERIVRIAKELGREIATSDEVRKKWTR